MVHQSKMEALREALKAADEQLSQQKSLNTQLELEVRKQMIKVPSLKGRLPPWKLLMIFYLIFFVEPTTELLHSNFVASRGRHSKRDCGRSATMWFDQQRCIGVPDADATGYYLLFTTIFTFRSTFVSFFGLFENAFPFLFLCYSNILNFGRFAFDAGVEKQTGGHWSLRE